MCLLYKFEKLGEISQQIWSKSQNHIKIRLLHMNVTQLWSVALIMSEEMSITYGVQQGDVA